MQHH